MKNEMVQMEVLIRICRVLNCKIDDLVNYSYNDIGRLNIKLNKEEIQ